MLLRKCSCGQSRQSAVPTPLCVFDARGPGHLKMPSFARRGAVLSSEYRFCCRGQGWRMKRGKNPKKHGRDLGMYPTLLAAQRTLPAQERLRTRVLNVGTYIAYSSVRRQESCSITTILVYYTTCLAHIWAKSWIAVNQDQLCVI